MEKVSVYLRNRYEGPSCYYRVYQYIEDMDQIDFHIHDAVSKRMFRYNLDYKGAKIGKVILQSIMFIEIVIRRIISLLSDLRWKPDIIIISRTIIPRKFPRMIQFLFLKLFNKTKVIWDFDDYIFEEEISERESEFLQKYSSKIIVTNNFLKNKVNENAQKKVILLPTTDKNYLNKKERDFIHRKRLESYKNTIKIIWVGTSSNINNLKLIIKQLEQFDINMKREQRSVELIVVCNKEFEHNGQIKIKNVRWSRKNAIKYLKQAHIGIMPLANSEYAKGKGGFKLIQYLGMGLPIIASKVGFNKEIVVPEVGYLIDDRIESDKWLNAIEQLACNEEIWKSKSKNAYEFWENHFSYEHNLQTWITILKDNRRIIK